MTAKGGRFQGRVLGRSNNNANVNAGVAYSNTNNASSNSNTNNGGRLCLIKNTLLPTVVHTQLKFNRSYGKRSRDGQKTRTRNLSLGNSNHSSLERTGKDWKAGTSQSAAYYGQVDWKQAESAMAAQPKKHKRTIWLKDLVI